MRRFDQTSTPLRRAICLALTGAGLALTSQGALADEGESQELDEVVVTGFRGSLNTALGREAQDHRRPSTASSPKTSASFPTATSPNRCSAFPASRCRAVTAAKAATSRCAASDPRSRACASTAWKAAAQTGSSDIYGAGNNGRSFDFNVFPTEIFSAARRCARRRRPMSKKARSAPPWISRRRGPSTTPRTRSSRSPAAASTTRSAKTSIRALRCCTRRNSSTTRSACSPRSPTRSATSAKSAIRRWTSCSRYQRQRPRSLPRPILLPFCTPIGWTATGTSPVPTGKAQGRHGRRTAAPTIRAPATIAAYQDGLRHAPAPDVAGNRPGQRRLPAAPAALREFRAGHRAHRRHADAPVEADREHHAFARWPDVAIPAGTPRQLHPRSVLRPQHHATTASRWCRCATSSSTTRARWNTACSTASTCARKAWSTSSSRRSSRSTWISNTSSPTSFSMNALRRPFALAMGRTDAPADLHGRHRRRQLHARFPRRPRDAADRLRHLDVSDPNNFRYAPAAGRHTRRCSAASRCRASRRENITAINTFELIRRLADDGDVRPEGRRAIPRERFQQPRFEPPPA